MVPIVFAAAAAMGTKRGPLPTDGRPTTVLAPEDAPARTPGRNTAAAAAGVCRGRSVGSPTEGRLLGGVRIVESECLRVYPVYASSDVRWGLETLVGMIHRAARVVRRQYPGAVMSVGHLSREGGGDIDRHRSHESGRDADIGFYIRNASGKRLFAENFVAFRGDGTAPNWPGAVFDDGPNWALVAALLEDDRARVINIFVAAPIRARLLAYSEKIHAPQPLRLRAAELMMQPRGVLPHDDHFHVRIACPAKMAGCVEYPAFPRARTAHLSRSASEGRRGTRSARHPSDNRLSANANGAVGPKAGGPAPTYGSPGRLLPAAPAPNPPTGSRRSASNLGRKRHGAASGANANRRAHESSAIPSPRSEAAAGIFQVPQTDVAPWNFPIPEGLERPGSDLPEPSLPYVPDGSDPLLDDVDGDEYLR